MDLSVSNGKAFLAIFVGAMLAAALLYVSRPLVTTVTGTLTGLFKKTS